MEDRFKLIIDSDNNNHISYRGIDVKGVRSFLLTNESLLLIIYWLLKQFPELQVDDVKIYSNNELFNKIGFDTVPVIKKGITRLAHDDLTTRDNTDDVEWLADFFKIDIVEITLKDDNDNRLTIQNNGVIIDDGLFVGVSERNTRLTLSEFLNVVNRVWTRE